jgi:hypothetical protein
MIDSSTIYTSSALHSKHETLCDLVGTMDRKVTHSQRPPSQEPRSRLARRNPASISNVGLCEGHPPRRSIGPSHLMTDTRGPALAALGRCSFRLKQEHETGHGTENAG